MQCCSSSDAVTTVRPTVVQQEVSHRPEQMVRRNAVIMIHIYLYEVHAKIASDTNDTKHKTSHSHEYEFGYPCAGCGIHTKIANHRYVINKY